MRKLLVSIAVLFPAFALADANCTANPKNEWKSEAEARTKFEKEGYKINKFKVSGNCYEIYGFTREGKKAEIYFDTKTLAIVKQEIED